MIIMIGRALHEDVSKNLERSLFLFQELADVIRGCICVNLAKWSVERENATINADLRHKALVERRFENSLQVYWPFLDVCRHD
jgi:hypothetical protein